MENEAAHLAAGDVAALLRGWFVANDLVPLNYCRNAHSRGAILRLLVYADHFAHRANKDFGSPRDFGGQRERDVELRSRAEFFVNGEINTASGNVACFSAARGCFFFYRHPNDDR